MKQSNQQQQAMRSTITLRPQMQRSLKMLQMSSLELEAAIAEIIERNPALMLNPEANENTKESFIAEEGDEIYAREAHDTAHAASEVNGASNSDVLPADFASAASGGEAARYLGDTLTNLEEQDSDPGAALLYAQASTATRAHHHEPDYSNPVGLGEKIGRGDWAYSSDVSDTIPEGEATLRSHLERQVNLAIPDAKQRICALALVDALDDTGYLLESLESIAQRIGALPPDMRAAYAKVRTFDPAGVFAADLRDCLRMQLAGLGHLDPVVKAVTDHLELVAQGDLAAISAITGFELEDVHDAVAELLTLNPKPGAQFQSSPLVDQMVDAVVRQLPNGSWSAEITEHESQRLEITPNWNTNHRKKKHRQNPDAENFMRDCFQEARWLQRTIKQRQSTLLGVVRQIVQRQHLFFEYGVRALKPVSLREVAEDLGLHESTISRAVNEKYVATPFGVFELRYFFSSGVSTAGHQGIAATAAQQMIRDLVTREDANKPLSDSAITKFLQQQGIDIARRTVAKYREAAGIDAVTARRREYARAGLKHRKNI